MSKEDDWNESVCKGKSRAVMEAARHTKIRDKMFAQHNAAFCPVIKVRDEVIDTATGKVVKVTEREFCPACEFIRIMNPDGLGWCRDHGDIDGRDNDPRNHTGEHL